MPPATTVIPADRDVAHMKRSGIRGSPDYVTLHPGYAGVTVFPAPKQQWDPTDKPRDNAYRFILFLTSPTIFILSAI
jgi:hypothetical protein